MFTLYLYPFGLFAFVFGAVALGVWLRKHRSEENAQRSSRIMQFLFFAGLSPPPIIAVFYPGLTHLDELVGFRSLSPRPFFLAIGIILALPGVYFLVAPNISLRKIGSGANAFRLTKKVVDSGVYAVTRNPMSLGYYLLALAIALFQAQPWPQLQFSLLLSWPISSISSFLKKLSLNFDLGNPIENISERCHS